MTSVLIASAVLLLVSAGAQAGDVQLGNACTSSDTCVDDTLELVCDDFDKTCRIKHGQDCTGDGHGDLCVTGAACSSTCACETSGGIYAEDSATGKCTFTSTKYGSDCSSSTGATCDATGSTLSCNSDERCGCATDFQPNLADGFCVAIANEEVGNACTVASQDTDCGASSSSFMTCQSLVCTCNAGYAGPVGGSCTVIASSKVGKACTSSTATTDCGDQTTTNLECSSDACACETGYFGVLGGVCSVAKGLKNGPCSGSNQGTCSSADHECTGSPKLCKVKLGKACEADSDCSVSNTKCQSGTCKLKVDETCTDNTDKCVTGATCSSSSNNCECATPYTEDTTNKICVQNVALGGSCLSTDTCTATSGGATATCDILASKCRLKVDEDCTGNTDKCVSGASCTSNTCSCTGTVYTEDSTNKICTAAANKVGGTCTSGSCTDMNARCDQSGYCVCNSGYSTKTSDATCQANGAAGMGAAIVTVMLLAIMASFF